MDMGRKKWTKQIKGAGTNGFQGMAYEQVVLSLFHKDLIGSHCEAKRPPAFAAGLVASKDTDLDPAGGLIAVMNQDMRATGMACDADFAKRPCDATGPALEEALFDLTNAIADKAEAEEARAKADQLAVCYALHFAREREAKERALAAMRQASAEKVEAALTHHHSVLEERGARDRARADQKQAMEDKIRAEKARDAAQERAARLAPLKAQNEALCAFLPKLCQRRCVPRPALHNLAAIRDIDPNLDVCAHCLNDEDNAMFRTRYGAVLPP